MRMFLSRICLNHLDFGHSYLFRISNFVLRISYLVFPLVIKQKLFRIQHSPQHVFSGLAAGEAGGLERRTHQRAFIGRGKAGERAQIDFIGNLVRSQ